jgi:hypothetical protein
LKGGSTLWLSPKEIENIELIYNYLEENTDFSKKKLKEFSISKISEKAKIHRQQVSRYVLILSVVEKPFEPIIKIRASHFGKRIVHLVKLIRTL